MFNGEMSDVSNLNWMKRIDNYLTLLIAVGIWGEGVGNDTETLVSERTNITFELLQILVNWKCLFGWMPQLNVD
jgi:hypothetical protein